MVIQTISKNYKVIRTLSPGTQIEAYLCRDERETEVTVKERYLVMGLTGNELSRNMIPYFMELSTGRESGDFLDCFIHQGRLWLVFQYYEYQRLSEKLKMSMLFRERLEAGKTLMDRILSQNLPCYLQYEALKLENLVMADTCEVYFNYVLREPQLFDQCSLSHVCQSLAEVFELLFSHERKEAPVAELTAFLEKLRGGQYRSYTQIYRDYRELYQIMLAMESMGQLKPKGWLVSLWERIKFFGKKLKQLLSVALVVVLTGFLIYTCVRPKPLPEGRIEFDRIGTLELEKNREQKEK